MFAYYTMKTYVCLFLHGNIFAYFFIKTYEALLMSTTTYVFSEK